MQDTSLNAIMCDSYITINIIVKLHPPPCGSCIDWFQLLTRLTPLGIELDEDEGGGVYDVVKVVLSQLQDCVLHILTTFLLTEVVDNSYISITS